MCGICGVVNASGDQGAVAATVAAMTADLERRGPDDEGQWRAPASGTALGFRRLSIIDPTPAGAQPMVAADGADVVVFNGEIYNHPDLRAELAAAGARFRSRSDTEVLLEALRRWGLDALPRLRGMFAVAWYRPDERRLVLARDHLGIKPLHYVTEPGGPGVAFSSRYDGLARTGWLDLDAVDHDALAAYLWHRRVPSGTALQRSAAEVPPGGLVVVGPTGVRSVERWWTPPPPTTELRGEAAVEATAEVLEVAVRRHLRSDVPLGVFLSGGVDSPLVAGTTARLVPEPVRSFTVAVPSWPADEGPIAARLADTLGLAHRSRALGQPDPTLADDVVAAMHQPLNDLSLLPTLAVSALAREDVTVALSGDGGDELFFGYLRPWSVDDHHGLWRLPRRLRRVPIGLLGRAGRLHHRASLHRDPGAYYAAMHRSGPAADLLALAPGLAEPRPEALAWRGPPTRRRLADFGRDADTELQLHRVLAKVDMASMHHSLEVRVPLLDPDVIAVSRRIDPCWTLDQPRTKPVLRTLLDRLVGPDRVPAAKSGFSVPLGDWLRGPLAERVEDTLAGDLWPTGLLDADAVRAVWATHRRGEDRTILLWGLLCLQWWAARMAAMPRGPGC